MASGSHTPSSVMPYSTTIRFSIWAGSPPLVMAISPVGIKALLEA
jgi:hypothetical protein